MKASRLPPDDELRRLIVRRYGEAVGYEADASIKVPSWFGTKPDAPWRRGALFAVNDLRAGGATITDALRGVFEEHELGRIANSSFASFKRSYQKFRTRNGDKRAELHEHFLASVWSGDLDEAISALKFCSDETRQEIWTELTRDKPPPPRA